MNKFIKKLLGIILVLFISGCANNNQPTPQNPPIPKSCLSIYHNYSSKNLCDIYWENKNPFCDYDLRIILSDRKQSITPRSICGQAINSSPSNSCKLSNISQITPTNLCNTYYSTSNCNSEIRGELTKRNLKSAPKDDCGNSINANLNTQIIKVTSESKQCQSYLNEIYSDSTPVKAACTERYKSKRDETIICRQNLTAFINANSRGVGKSLETCGIKIN